MSISPAEYILRHAIGFDNLVRSATLGVNNTNFPPFNIEEVEDDLYRLTLALAGYSKDDLSISEHNGVLTVSAQRPEDVPGGTYIHRGIALREFTREWKLGEHIKVSKADMENGLLVIDLVRHVPDEAKPKQIAIG